jgi:hypothetical protein
MHEFAALATDYDGTLATDGRVQREVLDELRRFRAAGHELIMVTGRELPDLKRVFPHFELFDRIVAENGALLYRPQTQQEQLLAEPACEQLVKALRARGVSPLSVGRSIVATWEPHEITVLETIKQLGIEREIIFNKGAVMILPTGVNKSTGLNAALAELNLPPWAVVGVGDAENDHAFLSTCGWSVAVGNALPSLKQRSNMVTAAERGFGVVEAIHKLFVAA